MADLEGGGARSSPPKTYIPEGQSCYSSGCDASMAGEENCVMRAVLRGGGSFTRSSCTSRLENYTVKKVLSQHGVRCLIVVV